MSIFDADQREVFQQAWAEGYAAGHSGEPMPDLPGFAESVRRTGITQGYRRGNRARIEARIEARSTDLYAVLRRLIDIEEHYEDERNAVMNDAVAVLMDIEQGREVVKP